jgi:alkylglycerol monooxygenase
LKDKVKYLFMKPGWLPESLGGYRPAPEVNKGSYQKYNPTYPVQLNYYVLFQYILCLTATAFFLFQQKNFNLYEKAEITLLISVWVVNCGVLFEQKKWVFFAEWIRIALYTALTFIITYQLDLPGYFYWIGMGYGLVSGFWYSRLISLRNEKVVVA